MLVLKVTSCFIFVCLDILFILFSIFVAPCPRPGNVKGRNALGDDFRHGKSITFWCDRYYTMMGGRQRISCDDGRWNHDFPTCKGNLYSEFITLGIVHRYDEHLRVHPFWIYFSVIQLFQPRLQL